MWNEQTQGTEAGVILRLPHLKHQDVSEDALRAEDSSPPLSKVDTV